MYGGQQAYYGGQPNYAKNYNQGVYQNPNYASYGQPAAQGGYSQPPSYGTQLAGNCLSMCCASFCANLAMAACCDCLTPGGFF